MIHLTTNISICCTVCRCLCMDGNNVTSFTNHCCPSTTSISFSFSRLLPGSCGNALDPLKLGFGHLSSLPFGFHTFLSWGLCVDNGNLVFIFCLFVFLFYFFLSLPLFLCAKAHKSFTLMPCCGVHWRTRQRTRLLLSSNFLYMFPTTYLRFKNDYHIILDKDETKLLVTAPMITFKILYFHIYYFTFHVDL